MKIIGKVFILLTVIALILVPTVGCPTPPPEPSGEACIWVANSGDDNVMKLDLSTGNMFIYDVGNYPIALAFDGTDIWVANAGSVNVMKLDASSGSLLGTYAVGSGPMAFDGANIWVANAGSVNVMKLDASTGSKTSYNVGVHPRALLVTAGCLFWSRRSRRGLQGQPQQS